MEKNQVLAIMGSPSSGKTTTAIKLALLLAKQKKNVVIVFCDPFTPVIPFVLPVTAEHHVSLGSILTASSITQKDVIKACVPTTQEYIAVLGYKKGESLMQYPMIVRERVVEVFTLLRHFVDYVIVDCSTVFEADPTSILAIEIADQVLKLGTANLKGISYYQSHEKMLLDSCFRKERQKMAIGALQVGQDWEAVSEQYKGVAFVLPYIEELDQQNNELCLFEPLMNSESSAYQKELEHMAREIFLLEEHGSIGRKEKVEKQKKKKEQKERTVSFQFPKFFHKKKGEF